MILTRKPNRPESPYDRLNMTQMQAILGLPQSEILRLMSKGWIRWVRRNSKRTARRADVMACKARLEVPAEQPK